ADPEIQVRRDGEVGGPVVQTRSPAWTRGTGTLLVDRRILRVAHGPNFLALHRALGDDAMLLVAEVEVFGLAFLGEVHAMRAAPEHGAPRSDELALGIEDDDRIRALTGLVHSVVNVDVTLRVLNHAVRIPVLNVGRQVAPIVNTLVLVFTL